MVAFENLRFWIVEKLNPAQGSIVSQEPISAPENISDFQKAYREIEVVNRCVDIIISSAVDVPLAVTGGASKKISKLINDRPNPFEDRARFFRRALLDFMLDGNVFFYYDGSNIFLLPANSVEIIPDPKKFVASYNYTGIGTTDNSFGISPSRNRRQEADQIKFKPDEIIHIRNDNDESIYRGKSRLACLERIMELYYALINFQQQFFKNNGVPGFVLKTENVLSQKVKDRLLEHWRQSYSSIFNGARSPAILDGGLEIDKFSQINFQELDFEASVDRLQQDMAKALGVPYVLLKSGNNANIGANQVLFYTHTVLPILNLFCSAFAHYFGNEVEIMPDRMAVPALQPDNKTQALYVTSCVNSGVMIPDEGRKILRLPELGGEMAKIRVPQNITGSATNPSVGGRPSGVTIPAKKPTSSANEEGKK